MPLHMHFRWGVTLVGKLSTGLCSPRRGTPFRYRDYPGRQLFLETDFEESRVVALMGFFLDITCIRIVDFNICLYKSVINY